jgi:two-component system LytT family response regulator
MITEIITAVIVDDEQSAREILRSILASHCPMVHILGEADSIQSAKVLIGETKPVVIFLDIEMPGGSGFELLNEIRPTNSEVIFTTAHNHYAINAFRSFALDYLLKPINPAELIEAVSKVKRRDSKLTYSLLELLSQQLASRKEYADQIAVPSVSGLEIVKVDEIIYCEGDGNYTTFYISGTQKITSSKTLKEYERMLSAETFVRSHQKFLVNVKFVKRYIKGRGGALVMSNGANVEVAHSKKQQVIDALGKL